jgi:F420H(2)-dependent quinone reductase
VGSHGRLRPCLYATGILGSSSDPQWAHLATPPEWWTCANPDVTIEAVVGDDIAPIPVHATELEGEDREAAFRRFVKVVPAFQAYQAQDGRRLPVMRLTPRR